jgi:hypothetical protein
LGPSIQPRFRAQTCCLCLIDTNEFEFCREGGGEGVGGVRGVVEENEEEELKEKINMKVSTKFQIKPSANG